MINLAINYQVKVASKYEALFLNYTKIAFKLLQLKPELDLSVAFVSPLKIKDLNNRYRSKNKATDVLSFEEPEEVVICYQQAKKQARELNKTIQAEVSFLFVHGLLHILGFDHQTDADEKIMNSLTEKILNNAKNN